jgi:hypothetical protein
MPTALPRSFAAEAEAHQRAGNQQLFIVLRQSAQEGEEGEPEDGQLQRAHPADAVRQDPGHPAAGGGGQQRGGADEAGVRTGDAPGGDQRGNHKAQELRVHGVQRVADLAAPERAAFVGGDVAIPGKEAARWLGVRGGVSLRGGVDTADLRFHAFPLRGLVVVSCQGFADGSSCSCPAFLKPRLPRVQLVFRARADKKN